MWAGRINWKRYVAAAIVVCIVTNVLCVWFHTLGVLMALRFAAGIASGVAYASSLALMSRVEDTARGFSVVIFAQVVANAAVLEAFPAIDARWGPGGMFVAIAAVMAATAVVVPRLPGRDAGDVAADRGAGQDGSMQRGTRPAIVALCLGAVALVYVAIGSYWAYADRMGLALGISAGVVHQLLTASVLLSTIGCLAAFRLSRSAGQSRPLLGALVLLSLVLLVHSGVPRPVMYVLTLGVMQMCWNFIDIFQLGTLAIADPSGRGAALVPAAQGVALAAGPAAGGLVLSEGRGYWAVLLLAGSAAALATACYSIAYVRYLRTAERGAHS
jgi:predicted MFS family arabinose efflux permease